jgi:acyl carrier protein phosphodiesterase
VNHLAHFQLAGECEGLTVGALLGDYVKGPLAGALEPALERGVRLHRRVDAFTDTHAELRALRQHFGAGPRRLAGVVTDLFFDRLLTRHWARFEAAPLPAFSARVYAALERHAPGMPQPAARQARRIVDHDLLCRYGEAEVLEGSLERIGTRLGQAGAMRDAIDVAWARQAEFEEAFLRFYPQAIAFARSAL